MLEFIHDLKKGGYNFNRFMRAYTVLNNNEINIKTHIVRNTTRLKHIHHEISKVSQNSIVYISQINEKV